jgi:hypothetical protein
MVSMDVVLEPLVRLGATDESEQVTPGAGVHVRLTAPLKPFIEARLITDVPLLAPPLTLMGTIDVCGIREKSESGFEIGFPLFSV